MQISALRLSTWRMVARSAVGCLAISNQWSISKPAGFCNFHSSLFTIFSWEMGKFFHIIAIIFIRLQLVLLFLHGKLIFTWLSVNLMCITCVNALFTEAPVKVGDAQLPRCCMCGEVDHVKCLDPDFYINGNHPRFKRKKCLLCSGHMFGLYVCLSEGGGKPEWCVCPRVALVPSHWRHAADTPGGISRELPKAWWDNSFWTLFLSLLYNGHQRTLMLLADHCLGAVHPGICLQRAGPMQGTEVKKERCRTHQGNPKRI